MATRRPYPRYLRPRGGHFGAESHGVRRRDPAPPRRGSAPVGLSAARRGCPSRDLAARLPSEEPVFSNEGLSPFELLSEALAKPLVEGVAAARGLSRESVQVAIAEVSQVRVEIDSHRRRRARQLPELLLLVPQHRNGEEEWISPWREKSVPPTVMHRIGRDERARGRAQPAVVHRPP